MLGFRRVFGRARRTVRKVKHMKTKTLVTLSVIALGTVFAASAHAGSWSVDVAFGGPVYYPAPVVVTAPPGCAPPVGVCPPPRVVCYPPRPVCPPVVYAPPYRGWGRYDYDRYDRHDWRRGDRDDRRDDRHGNYGHDRFDRFDRDDRDHRGPGHR